MRFSRPEQLVEEPADAASGLAKPLAPEEIRPGDVVSVLHEITEWPSFLWCADATVLPADEPVRIRHVPEGGGVPLKVKSVCLPFVLVKSPVGDRQTLRTIDVRRCRLARLDADYARTTWRSYKRASELRRRRRRK